MQVMLLLLLPPINCVESLNIFLKTREIERIN